MKLLTLNTHSWLEENQQEKLAMICDAILEKQFDVIALQEVNQSLDEEQTILLKESGYREVSSEIPIKENNFALLLQKQLAEKGLHYDWTWQPSNVSYEKYDEGLSLLSRFSIEETKTFYASRIQEYANPKTRAVLGIKTQAAWFFTIHLGWWEDEVEPFKYQWETCSKEFEQLEGPIFLMGDFNNPRRIRNEGYDLVTKNWLDTYELAAKKDKGFTITDNIAGWSENDENLRIDFIFANTPVNVAASEVIFNGRNYPVVSDHYGVTVDFD